MKSASVRDLRQDFPRVLAWIKEGEEVVITMRREEIARLVPRRRIKKKARALPDFSKRLERVFGSKIIPEETMRRIMDDNRGAI